MEVRSRAASGDIERRGKAVILYQRHGANEACFGLVISLKEKGRHEGDPPNDWYLLQTVGIASC